MERDGKKGWRWGWRWGWEGMEMGIEMEVGRDGRRWRREWKGMGMERDGKRWRWRWGWEGMEMERDGEGEGDGEGRIAGADAWEKSPEDMLIDRENLKQLESAIEKELSPLEKQVLDLYLTGMGYVQIAGVLGRDEKSTDNALQRIRGKLRKAFRKEE